MQVSKLSWGYRRKQVGHTWISVSYTHLDVYKRQIQYKLIVLGIVYCFTILTPTITIFLFRKINGFARQALSERKKRYVPILLTLCLLYTSRCV